MPYIEVHLTWRQVSTRAQFSVQSSSLVPSGFELRYTDELVLTGDFIIDLETNLQT